jgi:hypothetical protein
VGWGSHDLRLVRLPYHRHLAFCSCLPPLGLLAFLKPGADVQRSTPVNKPQLKGWDMKTEGKSLDDKNLQAVWRADGDRHQRRSQQA